MLLERRKMQQNQKNNKTKTKIKNKNKKQKTKKKILHSRQRRTRDVAALYQCGARGTRRR
jgi:hypothetical protein